MMTFEKHSLEENTQSLADTMPNGGTFLAKNIEDSNLRNFLEGVSAELERVEALLVDITNEHYIFETIQLIENWESALGIPDICFDTSGTLNERRRQCIAKLLATGTQTAQDFVNVAKLFGIDITIEYGVAQETFPFTFPMVFLDEEEAAFTIIISLSSAYLATQFPMTFPFTFTFGTLGVLECFLNRLKPANVQIIYKYV